MTKDLMQALRESGPVCPAIQLRMLLAYGRECGWSFDSAWRWSFERVRFPHDTTARREWKLIIGEGYDDPGQSASRQRAMWQRAYERAEATRPEAAGGRLLVGV